MPQSQEGEQRPLAAAAGAATFGTFEPGSGLTSFEAKRRLEADGRNVLDPLPQPGFFTILLAQAQSTIFVLTMIAAVISHLVGSDKKACVLVGLVVFVLLVNAIGEYSGQDAGAELLKMSSSDARVMRDGGQTNVPTQELVVGDVVLVQAGDLVPADMVVLESVDLQAMEGVLTGEAHEVFKTVDVQDKDAPFPSNMIYSGTSIVRGTGKGEVVATGMRTQIGLIAKRMAGGCESKDGHLSPLQQSVSTLGKCISVVIGLTICTATALAVKTRYRFGTTCSVEDFDCLVLSALLRGVIMSVALIPHGMPFVTMVMLQVSAKSMKQRNALVTRKTAVDYLAATSVICTDKTGTLTQGRMTAQVLVGMYKGADDASALQRSSLSFYPLEGLNPSGGLYSAQDLSPEVEAMLLHTDDDSEKGLLQPTDLSKPGAAAGCAGARLADAVMARAHLACAFLGCHSAVLKQTPGGPWEVEGSLTEAALKVAAAKGELWDDQGLGSELRGSTHQRVPELEVPFTGERKMSATIHKVPKDVRLETLRFASATTHFAIVKGAPDKMISKLTHCMKIDGSELVVSGETISKDEQKRISAANQSLASRALRSLLVSVRPLGEAQVAQLKTAGSAASRLELILGESGVGAGGLCFVSLWGIFDPPRATVPKSVKDCHDAGIRVVMITGDQVATARAIGGMVNIVRDVPGGGQAALCAELHVGAPPLLAPRGSEARLSKRGSVLLQTAEHKMMQAEMERRSGSSNASIANHGQNPAIIASEFEKGAAGKEASVAPYIRKLSVHDDRDMNSGHEPHYKAPEAMAELTAAVSVWARAAPTDKVAIVESLAAQGHIAAMTGDGVNDAPALMSASVGVSMGSGTAVTRNASDLVLLDDDFSTIVLAIQEGRIIYGNMQKYTVAVISVKSGECLALLVAIAVGVPLPMTPTQQMYNLIITHILVKATIAFETGEEYVMKVPPRKTKNDILMRQNMWIWRWLPHVLFFTLAVHACLEVGNFTETGFVTAAALQGSSVVNELSSGRAVCEFAGSLGPSQHFSSDHEPFHCRCFVREHGKPWTEAREVDQWGPSVDSAAGASPADMSKHFALASTPWRNGTESLLSPCSDSLGVQHYCWKNVTSAERPVLPHGKHCADSGTRRAQAMTFVAIQLMESMTVLTMRRDDFSLPFLFTNHWFTGMVSVKFILLAVALNLSIVAGELDLIDLSFPEVLLAACFAVALFGLHELAKIFYRASIQRKLPQKHEEAKRKSLAPGSVLLSAGQGLGHARDDGLSDTASSGATSRASAGRAKALGP